MKHVPKDDERLQEHEKVKQMSRDEFIEFHSDKFVRPRGGRRLFLSSGINIYPVKKQKNGRLSAPAREVIGEIYDSFLGDKKPKWPTYTS